jgi:hypothetical protein
MPHPSTGQGSQGRPLEISVHLFAISPFSVESVHFFLNKKQGAGRETVEG